MSKVNVIDLSGNVKSEIDLPQVFNESLRPDLIKKAVLSSQANRLQPYGPYARAGLNTSAVSWGSGRGVAMVPRLANSSRAARVPQSVGGRRAHPPKPETDRTEKINKKEKKLAIRSAIAATTNPELAKKRGHVFDVELPVVADDELENLTKTKDVVNFFKTAGLYKDVLRAKEGKHVRAGKGKSRGRKYRQKKSVLIVVSDNNSVIKAARNLPGVEVATIGSLNAELLAPGTHAGRLTVWTESAISSLEGMYR
ncbi:50S ribosomal protein L4P [Methanohalobium evestigatum Z-7303]|uniref:Large ribosomal subunit protein uL4 n=1 Tax=Methanohalobium evestigatum (strain ATCC BAA-1072 / DSM 3721 / NBRC 107634 / OCM 161 / Z-7303) TaxID=644295 RepID=D7E8T4_METEZ|nr:50S ribosomal protein L4 [Methanohalobium evestigatum]ADI73755.1 50S ribosomal protein L4P [Methanohalobium evestigatum Z-7303]